MLALSQSDDFDDSKVVFETYSHSRFSALVTPLPPGIKRAFSSRPTQELTTCQRRELDRFQRLQRAPDRVLEPEVCLMILHIVNTQTRQSALSATFVRQGT